MHIRVTLEFFLALAVGAFLVACGQSTSPSVGSGGPPPKGPTPTTAPYTVALGCESDAVGEYKPNGFNPDRQIKYTSKDFITALTYDKDGNLYVGINTTTDSWVDEYPPGSTSPSRHITDGIHHPVSLAIDPDGDLYVGNGAILWKDIKMYKPLSTRADLEIDTISYPSDMVFYNGLLWVADSGIGSDVVAYKAGSKAVKWFITDEVKPTQLSETGGNLYILNTPTVGKDYVREYNIDPNNRNRGEPIFARQINADMYNITAMTTDTTKERVYLGETNFGHYFEWRVYVFDRDGRQRYYVAVTRTPYSIVASKDDIFDVGLGNTRVLAQVYQAKELKGALKEPEQCTEHEGAVRLAIFRPPT